MGEKLFGGGAMRLAPTDNRLVRKDSPKNLVTTMSRIGARVPSGGEFVSRKLAWRNLCEALAVRLRSLYLERAGRLPFQVHVQSVAQRGVAC